MRLARSPVAPKRTKMVGPGSGAECVAVAMEHNLCQAEAMTRALVLGGGGPVGIGWESGLLVGLTEAGVGLRDADLVLGTSAGSAGGAGPGLGVGPGAP